MRWKDVAIAMNICSVREDSVIDKCRCTSKTKSRSSSSSDGGSKSGSSSSSSRKGWRLRKAPASGSCQKLLAFDNNNNNGSPKHVAEEAFGADLRVFSMQDIRHMTKNFRADYMLGEGGFGAVHKGYLDDGVLPVAVKVLNLEGLQGHREWLAEMTYLGQLRHPNLVKLLGYCCENEERVLVYEYMSRGSLEHHLFRKMSVPLPWAARMKIAYGAAKGLAFLHGAQKPVIYRDFKTSNILLDSDYMAKLSDFGLAKDGPEGDDTHVSTRVMGTYGYAAPEYVMTGHLTARSDVYSFGVVLLELLSGRRSLDKSRPTREQSLADWARPCLNDKRKLMRIMDPRLRLDTHFCVKAALKAATVAYACTSHNPKSRPLIKDVVHILEPLQHMTDNNSSSSSTNSCSNASAITDAQAQTQTQTQTETEIQTHHDTAAAAATEHEHGQDHGFQVNGVRQYDVLRYHYLSRTKLVNRYRLRVNSGTITNSNNNNNINVSSSPMRVAAKPCAQDVGESNHSHKVATANGTA